MSILLTSLNPIYPAQIQSFWIQHDPIEINENFQSFKTFDDNPWVISFKDSEFRENAEFVELHKTEDNGVFNVVIKIDTRSFNMGLYKASKYLKPYIF